MRRRPPHTVELAGSDTIFLQQLIKGGRTEQRVARRARLLLAMSDPNTVVQDLAQRLEQSRFAVWDLRRRFQERGVEAVFDAARSGRPRTVSPSGARRGRAVGLL
jgi:biotin operon repressor